MQRDIVNNPIGRAQRLQEAPTSSENAQHSETRVEQERTLIAEKEEAPPEH